MMLRCRGCYLLPPLLLRQGELRNEIEEIYEKHRDRAREAGHMDDVHRPDLGMHRLEYNDMLHESDPELLSYHEGVSRRP